MSILKVIILTDGGFVDLVHQILFLHEAHQFPTQILLDVLEDVGGSEIARKHAENSCDLTFLLK